jgi:hypothetical protein
MTIEHLFADAIMWTVAVLGLICAFQEDRRDKTHS